MVDGKSPAYSTFKASSKNAYIVFRIIWDLVFMSHINKKPHTSQTPKQSNRILFGLSLRALCVAA